MKCTIISFLTIWLSVMANAQDWKLAREKNGIAVFLADAEGTKIKQFKANAFVDASPKSIADAILDLDNNYKWLQNVEKAELVSRVSPTNFIYRQVVNVPYPFDDRLIVLQCTQNSQPGGKIRIDLKDKNDALPLDNLYVRMPFVRGYWLLTPKNTGTDVEYCFVADPGGSIPAWLINQFIVDGPINTLTALRENLLQ